jgi:hypothetical protein
LDTSIADILAITLAETFLVLLAAYASTPSIAKVEEFKQFIWARYSGQATDEQLRANGDRCVAYAHREADRQINKIRGVLAFDALFFGVAKVYYAEPDLKVLTEKTGSFLGNLLFYNPICLLLIAILVCLYLFVVLWSDVSIYRTFESEFKFICDVVRGRTRWLHFAIYLSFLSAVLTVVDLLFVIGPSS